MLKPDYRPGAVLDESEIADTGGYWSGKNEAEYKDSYHSNVGALLRVGKWLDYLKENGCYDNTRIIIVADHGRGIPFKRFDNCNYQRTMATFNPLLLVKDFNSEGEVKTNNAFVTNADTVALAIDGLDVEKTNPYTKKPIQKSSDFDSFNVYHVFEAGKRNAFEYKNLFTFPLKKTNGYNVHESIFEDKNWTPLSEISKME